MARIEQVNIRIPVEARSVISRIARRLREDHGFIHRLRRFMDEEENTVGAALLSERVAKIEGNLARVMHALPPEAIHEIERATGMLRTSREFSDPEQQVHEPNLPDPRWATGEGRGRRLTEEGVAEMTRLFHEGAKVTEIAEHLGVNVFAVKVRVRNILR